MAIIWVNPDNTTGDGLSRATGWPSFDYINATNYTTGADHDIRVAALTPRAIAGSFSFTRGSVTVTYTGASEDLTAILCLAGTTDMIALPAYVTTLLDVPYVVSGVTYNAGSGTLTLTTNYQGPTATVSGGIIMIRTYKNLTTSTATRSLTTCTITGGWLSTDSSSPTGISWFERTDSATTKLTSGDCPFYYMTVNRMGIFKYSAMFNVQWDSKFSRRNECYWIATTGKDALSIGESAGNLYSCHCGSNYGISTNSFSSIDNFVSFSNTGFGFPRDLDRDFTSGHVGSLYSYGNSSRSVVISSYGITIQKLYSARNSGETVFASSKVVIHNIMEASDSQFLVINSDLPFEVTDAHIAISNYSGETYTRYRTGEIRRNTAEAYNTECLRFAPSETNYYLTKNSIFAKVSTLSNTTLSFIVKRSADFNGQMKYAVFYQSMPLVDWSTPTSITTDYVEYTVTVPYTNIQSHSQFVELKVACNGSAGYMYFAERDGQYVRIEG